MKIVIINGSPRINGATSKILHSLEEKLLSYDNVSIEFVNIGEYNINPCRGCCVCYKSGKCYIDDDAENLSEKIASADGLIIGSPTYASNISGQLKQF
ncbi:MAG: flavodoxin family protein, partial [Huintestinicola sp.]